MLDDKKWKNLPPMPKPDSHIEFAWTIVNHSIIIAGGTTDKHPNTKKMILNGEIFRFDLDTLVRILYYHFLGCSYTCICIWSCSCFEFTIFYRNGQWSVSFLTVSKLLLSDFGMVGSILHLVNAIKDLMIHLPERSLEKYGELN